MFMLSEIGQPQKDKYYMIPVIWGTQKNYIHKDQAEGWLSETRGREWGVSA